MSIPDFYSSLTIQMRGEIGSTDDLDYFSVAYYFWIIVVWIGAGGTICIVIIFYLLANEVGFAHPKLIDIEQLKMLKLNDASKKFTIIDRTGVKVDPLQTCYYGFCRSVINLIRQLLASEESLSNYTNVSATDVLILLIDAVRRSVARSARHDIESSYLDAVLYIRRVQVAITSSARTDVSTGRKQYFVEMMLEVLAYNATCARVIIDNVIPSNENDTQSLVLHCATKAYNTETYLLAYGEKGTLLRAIRDMLSSRDDDYKFSFERQDSHTSTVDRNSGFYLEDDFSVEYILADFSDPDVLSTTVDHQLPPLEGNQRGKAVLRKTSNNDEILVIGYIVFHQEGSDTNPPVVSVSEKDMKTLVSELRQVCQLDSGLCDFCTDAMGTPVSRGECCHSGFGPKYKATKCICPSRELLDMIDSHNAVHGETLVTVKKNLFEDKASKARDTFSSSSTDVQQEPMVCICGSSTVEADDLIECSGQECHYGNMFHRSCLGLTKKLDGAWYCPYCTLRLTGRKRKLVDTEQSTKPESVKMEEES